MFAVAFDLVVAKTKEHHPKGDPHQARGRSEGGVQGGAGPEERHDPLVGRPGRRRSAGHR